MKWYSFLFAGLPILSLIAVGASCSMSPKITSVSSAEFEKSIRTSGAQLVDVRTPDEYAEGHIAGAMNIDVKSPDFISEASETLKKEDTVYVYCRSGKRSKNAAEQLLKKGYKVIDLDNGIMGWQADSLPVVND